LKDIQLNTLAIVSSRCVMLWEKSTAENDEKSWSVLLTVTPADPLAHCNLGLGATSQLCVRFCSLQDSVRYLTSYNLVQMDWPVDLQEGRWPPIEPSVTVSIVSIRGVGLLLNYMWEELCMMKSREPRMELWVIP